jgi:hypothetical protein
MCCRISACSAKSPSTHQTTSASSTMSMHYVATEGLQCAYINEHQWTIRSAPCEYTSGMRKVDLPYPRTSNVLSIHNCSPDSITRHTKEYGTRLCSCVHTSSKGESNIKHLSYPARTTSHFRYNAIPSVSHHFTHCCQGSGANCTFHFKVRDNSCIWFVMRTSTNSSAAVLTTNSKTRHEWDAVAHCARARVHNEEARFLPWGLLNLPCLNLQAYRNTDSVQIEAFTCNIVAILFLFRMSASLHTLGHTGRCSAYCRCYTPLHQKPQPLLNRSG